ncbi:ADP-ribosylation factor-binding protein GGA1-like isoform X2 [Babylonia areolata]|uniref:ADP-ribosylation factor-binding protein GGA1-like isoform X2 n=1 Tax=Babylonia areolata TaxID=304850 RepID=UPI003FD47BF8
MAEENVTLELLLNKATSPALHDDDWDAIASFCDQVNKELEGPQFAVRLLAHKMQSPTEREALCALSTLEACVKNCGRTFHQEIGKFRFLNELIKIVSPKYLGSKTSERVKKRCIELLYSWYKGLPHETKIAEAYLMLKKQKIIKEDPTYMDKTFDPFPPPKPRRADFEDEEKAKTLSRLLKSKNPDDLQAANRLIKNMVKEDAEKSERRSRRINELEGINNQVKLLTEMVTFYTTSSSRSDIEMMKELYENLEKQRPKLFRLASETEENETDAINDILKVNDAVTKAMSLYMKKVQGVADENGEPDERARDTSLLDLGFDSPARQGSVTEPASGASAILQSEFQNLGLGDAPPAASPYNDLGGLFASQQPAPGMIGGPPGAAGLPAQNLVMGGGMQTPAMGHNKPPPYSSAPSPLFPAQPPLQQHQQQQLQQQQQAAPQFGNLAFAQTSVFSAANSASSATASVTASTSSAAAAAPSAMADLDALGQSLLEKNRSKDFVPPPLGPQPKLTMNQLAAARMTPAAQPPLAPQQHASLLDSALDDASMLVPVQNSTDTTNMNSALQATPNTIPSSSSASFMDKDSSDSGFSPMVSAPLPTPPPVQTQELLPLTDVFVPLESIKPAEDVSPVTAYDKNGLKSMIHFSNNRPRPDVLVMVLSTLSTNAKAVKNFMFQAAVPKIMKVKLQPPSTTDLPAYNPILPPTAITQVLLIANPRKEKVRLKFKISYVLGEEPVTDVGDAEEFPVQ